MEGRAVLLMGASGAGKSGLALQLIALGADLVADDRTSVTRAGDQVLASCPPTIQGRIEARHVGLLKLPATPGPVPLALAVDLDRTEGQRLPEPHSTTIEGIALPCLYRVDAPHFAAAVLLYLRCSIDSAP